VDVSPTGNGEVGEQRKFCIFTICALIRMEGIIISIVVGMSDLADVPQILAGKDRLP
jgi:hypothetical protein